MTEFETDYLAHHGIKGQKWGVRRTPEQLGHAPKKPKESVVKKISEKYKQSKTKNSENSRERLKNYLIKHPKKIAKYGNTLTPDEAKEIIDRIQFDRKLKTIRDEEIQAGWKRLQTASNNVNTLYLLLNNSKNLYNVTAEINNALVDSGAIKNGKRWTRVGGKQNNDNN